MIPISVVRFGAAEEARVLSVLRSGSITQGEQVREFESLFAQTFGVKHAIAVNSGTTALIASIRALNLQPGDEVITTPFTFVATVNAILESGATVVFADIRGDDFSLDAAALRSRITKQTRALMPVHLYGQMGDMNAYQSIAAEYRLELIEDAAQAHGAMFGDHFAGSYGIGAFSLYATKNITTGEGGVVTTNDDHIADTVRVLRNQGMRERYVYEMAGNNYRLTDLQATLGIPQLENYDRVVETRSRNAAFLADGLKHIEGIVVPQEIPGRRHVWHQFTLRVTSEAAMSRDSLAVALENEGIATGIYYPKLVPDYDVYKKHPRVIESETPVASLIASESLSIPVHQHLSEADLTSVVAAVATSLAR